MRRKDQMGSQLTEPDTVTETIDISTSKVSSSTSKVRSMRRDGPGKKHHNESEKCRRNLMRYDLERLRAMVPMEEEFQKQTTLSLLHKARCLIRSLEAKERKHVHFKSVLVKEQRYLKRRLEQLQHLVNGGAIGLGNTLLLSAVTQSPPSLPPPLPITFVPPPQSETIPIAASGSVSEVVLPHILKRKQILLTTCAEPQMVIADMKTSNILNPDSMCLMIDEMEYLEGVPYFSAPSSEEFLEVEENVEEVIEVETVPHPVETFLD